MKKIRKGDFFNFNDKDNQMSSITLKTDEELLEEAIINEDYEAAAKLRDKIKKNK